MATSTTNLGLIKPAGTDKIRIANINQNMDTLDEKIGPVGNTSLQSQLTSHSNSLNGVESGIAIVANGNTHAAISSGDFVYVKNNGTLAEGMYIATAAVAANGTLSTSNLSSASSGGLNALQSSTNQALSTLNSNLMTQEELTLTAASDVTLASTSKAYKIGKFIVVYAKGVTARNFINDMIFSVSSGRNAVFPMTFTIGIGSEWDITSIGYGFISGKNFIGNVPVNKYFHIYVVYLYA